MNRVASVALSVLLCVIGSACETNPVGRQCFIELEGGAGSGTIVSSPALECESRTCLHYQGQSPDLCTAECESDDDCDKEGDACAGKFLCIVPVVVGPFCCKTMCVCEDYFAGLEAPPPTPAACNAENPANECCNLDGRRDNATLYPQCQ